MKRASCRLASCVRAQWPPSGQSSESKPLSPPPARLIYMSRPKGRSAMNDISGAGTFPLGDRVVKPLGYGAMQLAGPGVFGPPKNRDAAVAVLREAVARGVDHIDTSDFYGPH